MTRKRLIEVTLPLDAIKRAPAREPRYVRRPFENQPDSHVYSANYDLRELFGKSDRPG